MTDRASRDAHSWIADSGNDDDGSFTLESGGRAFDQRLPMRQKLVRGGLAGVVVVFAAFFMLGGPDAAGAFMRTLRQPPVGQLYAAHSLHSPLAVLPAPGARATTPDVRISPAAGNRGDAYACWAERSPATNGATHTDGALHFAVLTTIKAQWKQLKPPVAAGTRCTLAADTLREAWLTLATYVSTPSENACALPELFLSRTSGVAWVRVPWPDQWISACNVTLALTDGHLYITADDPLLLRNSYEVGAPERVMTTADAGKTWQVADVGLPFGSSVDLVGLRPGGHLLAATTDPSPPATGTLWESSTNGAGWYSLGQLPGAAPIVAVSADPATTDHGGWGRLYVVAQTLTNGIPNGLDSPLVETGFPGETWTPLSLPAPIAGNDDSFVNEIEAAIVGPGGALAVLRVAPTSTLNTVAPANYVWVWSPARHVWTEASFIIPANTIMQGTARDGGQMRIWMTQLTMGIPISVTIRVFTLTAMGAG